MVAVLCCYCGSENLIRDGHSPTGKQRYRCRACGRRSREHSDTGYSDVYKAEILAAYNECMSLRGIERAFGISRYTVMSWLKKRPLDASPSGADSNTVSASDASFSPG